MEIKVTVELGEKTFGILERLFGRIEPVSTVPEVKVEWVGGSQGTVAAPVVSPVATQPAQPVTPPVATQPAPTAAVPVAPTQPTAAPVQPAPAVAEPTQPTAVPTAAAPVYTLDALAAAANPLTKDKAKCMQLQALVQSYGVLALDKIPQDKYPEVAFALRGMGANI